MNVVAASEGILRTPVAKQRGRLLASRCFRGLLPALNALGQTVRWALVVSDGA